MVYNIQYNNTGNNITSYNDDKFSQIERITMYIDDAFIIVGEFMTKVTYAIYYDYDEMHTCVIVAIDGMMPSAYYLDTYEIGESREVLEENINSAIYTKLKSNKRNFFYLMNITNYKIKLHIKDNLDFKSLIIMNGV